MRLLLALSLSSLAAFSVARTRDDVTPHATWEELNAALLRTWGPEGLPEEFDDAFYGEDARALVALSAAKLGIKDEAVARDLWCVVAQPFAGDDGEPLVGDALRLQAERLGSLMARVLEATTGNRLVLELLEAAVLSWAARRDWEFPHLAAALQPPPLRDYWEGTHAMHVGDREAALAAFERAARDPSQAPRARFQQGCLLVQLGRHEEALVALAGAASAPAWEHLDSDDLARPEQWRAVALLALGRIAEARQQLVLSLGEHRACIDPARDPDLPSACASHVEVRLAGDSYAAAGDADAAWKIWTRGGCTSRLRARRAVDEPFEILLEEARDHVRGSLLVGARALAALGRPDLAAERIDWQASNCDEARGWEPDCLMVARLREQLSLPPRQPAANSSIVPEPLAAPRLVPFRERHVPRTHRRPVNEDDGRLPERVTAPDALGAYFVILVRHDARRVLAVSIGSELDRLGEVSPGGYWAHVSQDGGNSFEPPIYLGLTAGFPYVVRVESSVPPFDGDVLQLEVLRREIDTASITFPPSGLRVKRAEDHLLLRFPLDDLLRDRDGDALTDLVEERLALDPGSSDTDGDGLPDGADPSPRTPLRVAPCRADSVLAAALAQDTIRMLPAIYEAPAPPAPDAITEVEEVPDPGEASPPASTRAETSRAMPAPAIPLGGTLFLIGETELRCDARTGPRIIALTSAEMDAYREKFGPFSATHVTIVFDPSGTRALLVVSEDWRGGTWLATLSDSGWTFESVSEWIT